MEFHYTDEKNVQLVLALLKKNNIRKVIASPGATNESIVASMQYDPYFEMYSCVDERSAAYMACGMAVESGEVVVLSCTGATSSRDYLPALTEAYYRHIPILAITSSMPTANIGHLYPQCTNRFTPPADSVRASYCIESIKDDTDLWDRTIRINQAISELKRHGGGPVHLNLITRGCSDYSIETLPDVRQIQRILPQDAYPKFEGKKILLFIGERYGWTMEETELVDEFCQKYNAVALCDQTSGFKGKYRFLSALVASQENPVDMSLFECDLLIHIGGISGDYYTMGAIKAKEVWRVDSDGEMRDKFRKLTFVFEMPLSNFFAFYNQEKDSYRNTLLDTFRSANLSLIERMPELPFSNTWIASQLSKSLPHNSVVHLGILNSLRSWNFFEVDNSISTFSNVGGFGIDGILSTMIGAALCNKDKIYYAVLGDLAFFYDLNSIGNRNVPPNVRILLVNNGRGVEFHTYKHSASKFGENTDKYIAAYGHNGIKSPTLVKDIASSLGYTYITASNKQTFNEKVSVFINPSISHNPIIFEVFTEKIDDADVLRLIRDINGVPKVSTKAKIKQEVKNICGESTIKAIRNIIKH